MRTDYTVPFLQNFNMGCARDFDKIENLLFVHTSWTQYRCNVVSFSVHDMGLSPGIRTIRRGSGRLQRTCSAKPTTCSKRRTSFWAHLHAARLQHFFFPFLPVCWLDGLFVGWVSRFILIKDLLLRAPLLTLRIVVEQKGLNKWQPCSGCMCGGFGVYQRSNN